MNYHCSSKKVLVLLKLQDFRKDWRAHLVLGAMSQVYPKTKSRELLNCKMIRNSPYLIMFSITP